MKDSCSIKLLSHQMSLWMPFMPACGTQPAPARCRMPLTRFEFIQVCISVKLRENILQVPGMPMADILTMGWSKEFSKVRAAHMEAALQRQVKTQPVKAVAAARTDKKKMSTKLSPRTCYKCGEPFPHRGPCPVQEKRYSACNKPNHFEKVCKSSAQKRGQKHKTIHAMQTPENPEDEEDMDNNNTEGTIHVSHVLQPIGYPKMKRPTIQHHHCRPSASHTDRHRGVLQHYRARGPEDATYSTNLSPHVHSSFRIWLFNPTSSGWRVYDRISTQIPLLPR
ncbi:hypothetical protein NDU88_001943 [Pleurodeles waltl]|uniref:Uncharacterized protein n=1 Tax=Pleurodeles waltl TaxID=8319 RepID=A0AAV7WJV0_PLEWA|nr:hypothetical protein NDU88_001943 [Pleurodeles waltl]